MEEEEDWAKALDVSRLWVPPFSGVYSIKLTTEKLKGEKC